MKRFVAILVLSIFSFNSNLYAQTVFDFVGKKKYQTNYNCKDDDNRMPPSSFGIEEINGKKYFFDHDLENKEYGILVSSVISVGERKVQNEKYKVYLMYEQHPDGPNQIMQTILLDGKGKKSFVMLNLLDISSGEKLNNYFFDKWRKTMGTTKEEEVGNEIDLLTKEMHEHIAKLLDYGVPLTVRDTDYRGDKLVGQAFFNCKKK